MTVHDNTRPAIDIDQLVKDRRAVLDRMPVSERLLEVAGIATAILEAGSGDPLLLVHGPGEFAGTWMRVIPALSMTHRVIAVDLPGHGASGLPDGPVDLAATLGWLDDLIGQTCPTPPVVAGHLLGGAIALRYAAAYPGRVGELVLVDTYGLSRLWPSSQFSFAMAKFVIKPTVGTQRALMNECMVDLDAVRSDMAGDLERLERYALTCARQAKARVALRSLMPKFGLPAIPATELGQISIPVSLIWGSDDRQVPLKVAERASAHYGWPLHVIAGAADDPAVEKPDEFLAAFNRTLT